MRFFGSPRGISGLWGITGTFFVWEYEFVLKNIQVEQVGT